MTIEYTFAETFKEKASELDVFDYISANLAFVDGFFSKTLEM